MRARSEEKMKEAVQTDAQINLALEIFAIAQVHLAQGMYHLRHTRTNPWHSKLVTHRCLLTALDTKGQGMHVVWGYYPAEP